MAKVRVQPCPSTMMESPSERLPSVDLALSDESVRTSVDSYKSGERISESLEKMPQ